MEVASSGLIETLEPVYNLEVYGEHVYHVENSGILVHNGRGRYKAPKAKNVRAKPKAQSEPKESGRREQGPNDVTLKTRWEAFLEAMRRNGGSLDVFEEIPRWEKNPNLRGPKGEPWYKVRTLDKDGNIIEFNHHPHGHRYEDGTFEYPHYNGPNGEGHISYES